MYNTLCPSNTRRYNSLKIIDHFIFEYIWFYLKTFEWVEKSVRFTMLYFLFLKKTFCSCKHCENVS